jgi:hypothetical protein
MATISDIPISEGNSSIKSLPKTKNFKSKTPGHSCATPGAFIKVRIDHLELLKADDMDTKLKLLQEFLSQDSHHSKGKFIC